MSTDTKACPFCGESILAVAIKCKHCGEFLAQQPDAPAPVKADGGTALTDVTCPGCKAATPIDLASDSWPCPACGADWRRLTCSNCEARLNVSPTWLSFKCLRCGTSARTPWGAELDGLCDGSLSKAVGQHQSLTSTVASCPSCGRSVAIGADGTLVNHRPDASAWSRLPEPVRALVLLAGAGAAFALVLGNAVTRSIFGFLLAVLLFGLWGHRRLLKWSGHNRCAYCRKRLKRAGVGYASACHHCGRSQPATA